MKGPKCVRTREEEENRKDVNLLFVRYEYALRELFVRLPKST